VKNKSLIVLLAASFLAVTCFAADDPGDPTNIIFWKKDKDKDKDQDKKDKSPKQLVSSSVKPSETPIPRVWIGLTGSITPLKLLHSNNSGSITDAGGDTLSATTSGGMVGGGATVNARILKSFWLSVGAIYRNTGYDWVLQANDTNLDVFTERSRVNLIDFPVLVKYTGRKWNASKYTFYEAGLTLRDAVGRTTTTNWYDFSSNSLGPGVASGTNYNRRYYGATAGAGIIAKDDFGIIFSPEVRYTHWMGDTFNNNFSGGNLIGTQRNQLEITVSFGF
jgi:hypothetical protein